MRRILDSLNESGYKMIWRNTESPVNNRIYKEVDMKSVSTNWNIFFVAPYIVDEVKQRVKVFP